MWGKSHRVNNEKWKTNSKSSDTNDHKASTNHKAGERENVYMNGRSKQPHKKKIMRDGKQIKKLRLPSAHFTQQHCK